MLFLKCDGIVTRFGRYLQPNRMTSRSGQGTETVTVLVAVEEFPQPSVTVRET